jgi:cytoskeletal protein RodZ
MKSIGEIIKNARLKLNLTQVYLEKKTKIKVSFIDSIEKEEWEKLPPFPIVLGFVKSISDELGLDQNMAAAVLKRDYPPKKLRISPKPDVTNKFVWSPKLTFLIGVTFVVMLISFYLTYQYIKFRSPPELNVESPKDMQVVTGRVLNVFGSTDTDAKILVNNQPVMVSDDGKFSVNLDVVPETREVVVTASSRSGKATTISRRIEVR